MQCRFHVLRCQRFARQTAAKLFVKLLEWPAPSSRSTVRQNNDIDPTHPSKSSIMLLSLYHSARVLEKQLR